MKKNILFALAVILLAGVIAVTRVMARTEGTTARVEITDAETITLPLDKDGTLSGCDLPLTTAVGAVVGRPVIASGGCGSLEHFSEVFEKTGCDAALAASLFHYRELTVGEVKEHLKEQGIPVRQSRAGYTVGCADLGAPY